MLPSVVAVSALWRLVCVGVLVGMSHVQQAFDTSGSLVFQTMHTDGCPSVWESWAVPFVRWDTVYFVAVAAKGYAYEQMLAFQPGIVGVLRLAGYVSWLCGSSAPWNGVHAVVVTTLAANVATWLSPHLLYMLLRRYTQSEALAYTAAVLSILAPASATALSAPTAEPFYSLFSLLGMVVLAGERGGRVWLRRAAAALSFAVATTFRANGVLLAGYLLWDAAWAPPRRTFALSFVRIVGILPFVAVVWAPFVVTQLWAYARLCTTEAAAPWCSQPIPMAYTYIQQVYWYVCLLIQGRRPFSVLGLVTAAELCAGCAGPRRDGCRVLGVCSHVWQRACPHARHPLAQPSRWRLTSQPFAGALHGAHSGAVPSPHLCQPCPNCVASVHARRYAVCMGSVGVFGRVDAPCDLVPYRVYPHLEYSLRRILSAGVIDP